jgi:hypothetical protein
MEKNKFIEKFRNKSMVELQHIIDSPSSFEAEAVTAAKYLLKNPIVRPAVIESLENDKKNHNYKWILHGVVIFLMIIAIAAIIQEGLYEGARYVTWSLTSKISVNGWYSVLFGTGAYLKYQFHKPWLLERAKANESVARMERFNHWMLIGFMLFLSLFFLLK